MRYPTRPRPGDRVAVLSPSAGLPALFPDVYERGLRRLRGEFGLVPVEYPTTRVLAAPPADRARDLTAAFTDPSIRAVFSTVGGDDQITVVPYLSADAVAADPKPFFGYSDNTNLLHFLFTCGVVGYHGGSVLVHLGRGGAMHPLTAASLRSALFGPGEYELTCPDEFGDETPDWRDPVASGVLPPMRPADPWRWYNADRVVEGTTWGGNLEILHWLTAAGRVGDVDAEVLFIETSEELPPDLEVFRILRNMGERGLLGRFSAVLVGRAKAWDFERPLAVADRVAHAAAQRAAVRQALALYNPGALVVFDLDIGHTDPQLIIPYGGRVRVDGPARRITVRY